MNKQKITPLEMSLHGHQFKQIQDRISFILVSNNINRLHLERFINLDSNKPIYAQNKSMLKILIDVAQFLNVSTDFLLFGNNLQPNTQNKPSKITHSAIVNNSMIDTITIKGT